MVLSSFQVDFSNFLRNYALWICLALILIILITLFFLLALPKIKERNKKSKPSSDGELWVAALGGKDNIVSLLSSRSRLTLEVKNASLLDQDKLKSLGVSSIMSMAQKVILVIDNGADKIKEKIEKSI